MSNPLESAVNEHSCALACVVSLARSCGTNVSQAELIEKLTPQIPKWKDTPGLLNVVEVVGLVRFLLKVKSCILVEDKAECLRLLREKDTIGGFVITKKYWDQNGNLADFNHCKRILSFGAEGVELMNPKRDNQADTMKWTWEVWDVWHAYALIIKV